MAGLGKKRYRQHAKILCRALSCSPIVNLAAVWYRSTDRFYTTPNGAPPVYDKTALTALVRERALKFGDFTLASGKKAKYYLDGKQVTLDSVGSRMIGEGLLDL